MAAEFAALVPAEVPWGDCGDILVHGMASHLPRVGGRLQLERTAPYVPDVTLPGLGGAVVTDAVRRQMLAAGLTGCSFTPVDKARIVRLDWSAWDQTQDLPPVLPEPDEPEDYILSRLHDSVLADTLGDLWELQGELLPDVEVYPWTIVRGRCRLVVPAHLDSLPDIFRGPAALYTFFSPKAQSAFSAEALRWCRFEPAILD